MRNRIKAVWENRRGMTMIEIVVVMALIGIITIPVLKILHTEQVLFKDHQKAVSEKSTIFLLEEKIEQEIRFSKMIQIVNREMLNKLEEDQVALYIKKTGDISQLVRRNHTQKEVILFDNQLFNNHPIELRFQTLKTRKGVLQIAIKGEDYQIETALKLQNLNQNETLPWEDNEGEVVIYTK